jgi:hypothetical protein
MSISAAHTKQDLEQGTETIARVLRRYGVCQS